MELPAPEQMIGLPKVIAVVRREQASHPQLPPGETGFNPLRTHRLQRDSLRVLLERVLDEQDRVLGGRIPTAEELSTRLPKLDMALSETLRLYPPVWFGPRMTVSEFAFAGYRIPTGTHVVHSSWVTHRLREVFEDPEEFVRGRVAPETRPALPAGAYMPFGGGSRVCIGKRFGQLVVKAVATILLQQMRPELARGHRLRIAKVPTLSPAGALPMVRARAAGSRVGPTVLTGRTISARDDCLGGHGSAGTSGQQR